VTWSLEGKVPARALPGSQSLRFAPRAAQVTQQQQRQQQQQQQQRQQQWQRRQQQWQQRQQQRRQQSGHSISAVSVRQQQACGPCLARVLLVRRRQWCWGSVAEGSQWRRRLGPYRLSASYDADTHAMVDAVGLLPVAAVQQRAHCGMCGLTGRRRLGPYPTQQSPDTLLCRQHERPAGSSRRTDSGRQPAAIRISDSGGRRQPALHSNVLLDRCCHLLRLAVSAPSCHFQNMPCGQAISNYKI
jgi:hypothetical protein